MDPITIILVVMLSSVLLTWLVVIGVTIRVFGWFMGPTAAQEFLRHLSSSTRNPTFGIIYLRDQDRHSVGYAAPLPLNIGVARFYISEISDNRRVGLVWRFSRADRMISEFQETGLIEPYL